MWKEINLIPTQKICFIKAIAVGLINKTETRMKLYNFSF